jgi:hypothetical protein
MSEHDPWDSDLGQAIEGSLRRQFAPPSLDGLNEQIARAAAEHARHEQHEPATLARPRASWRRPVAAALVVAAAAALIWVLGPSPKRSADPLPQLVAHTSAQALAGRQLHDFLRTNTALPIYTDCAAIEPPTDCQSHVAQVVTFAPELRIAGECGGTTGIECADHGLPARRAILVQLEPSGASVIVCIEAASADPRPVLPTNSEYNIFRRTLGDYVLYEVTPLPQPMALDLITLSNG